MNFRHRLGPIARGSMQTLAVYGLRLVTQMALLFLVARYLGPSQFGGFAAIAALAVGLGTLSSFGLGFLVLGESAKSPERGQMVLAQAVPATLVSTAVLGPLYFWLCRVLLGSDASTSVLLLIGLSDLLLMPWLGLISHRMHGLGQVARSQLIAVIPMGFRLAGLVACVILVPDAGLEIYGIVYAGGALAGLLLSLSLAREAAAGFLHPERPQSATFRQGSGYAVMNFMAVNPSELDKAFALRLLGAGDAGLYALASRGMTTVTLPVIAMLLSAQPRIFREGDSKTQNGGHLIGTILNISIGYGLAAAILLHYAAPALLQVILGSQYKEIGEVVSAVAYIAPFMALRLAAGGILFALGRPMWRACIEGASLFIMIGLASIMTLSHGMLGLIWAVLASEATMAVLGCGALLWHRCIRTHKG